MKVRQPADGANDGRVPTSASADAEFAAERRQVDGKAVGVSLEAGSQVAVQPGGRGSERGEPVPRCVIAGGVMAERVKHRVAPGDNDEIFMGSEPGWERSDGFSVSRRDQWVTSPPCLS